MTFRGLGATLAEVDQQPIQVRAGELLRRQLAVALGQQRQRVPVGVDRCRAGVVQRRDPVITQLADRYSLARHKSALGRLITDLGQRGARAAFSVSKRRRRSARLRYSTARRGKTVVKYQLRVDGGVNAQTGQRQQVKRELLPTTHR
jgi:hypothetical protein